MTYELIPLPPAIGRLVHDLLRTVTLGLAALVAQFGPLDGPTRSNALAFADVSHARTLLRRLTRILHYAFIVLATRLEGIVIRARRVRARGDRAVTPASRRPRFVLSRRFPVIIGKTRGVQPAVFAHVAHDPLRALSRRMQALSYALDHPMAHVHRLARTMHRDTLVLVWRPPARPPRRDRREHWDELLAAHDQADFDLSRFRRQHRDTS